MIWQVHKIGDRIHRGDIWLDLLTMLRKTKQHLVISNKQLHAHRDIILRKEILNAEHAGHPVAHHAQGKLVQGEPKKLRAAD